MNVDFIIVGQGLAGTLLAHELFRLNKTFVVFDDPNRPKSSEVAAGLINPVVFRRMTKSWLADDAFPLMETTYRQLEELLKEQFYFPGKMLKILSEDGVCFWKEKVFASQLGHYLQPDPNFNFRDKSNINTYSFGCVNKSGRIDIQKLILSFSEFLDQQQIRRNEKFNCENLNFQIHSVVYDNLTAGKVIFCEGPAASGNPFFQKLKFKHSKGEILEVKIQELELNEIVSGEVFVMPVGDNRYKVGATYSWDELKGEITDVAREELLAKLRKITSVQSEVLSQKAGIRPTMHDRKPVIGLLPDNPKVGIFNGLGSKGVLLGPYFARQFAGFLVGNSAYIHPDANINRYFRHK